MPSFHGKTVWITGASSGIGEALARAFAHEGARLILSSRRKAELERVRISCPRPNEHTVLRLDLSEPATFEAATAAALRAHGHIDVLVNNGGVSQRGRAADTTAAVEREIMDIDYFAPVALTKTVLPGMRARQAGHIVVVSSVMGYVGTPGRSSYAAAKHALHGYFDSLRAELWRENIHVTLACPGYVRTAIGSNALGPTGETNARPARGIPAERCAAAVLRAVRRRKREVYIGGGEVLGIYLQRFAPWLYARIVRRMTFSVDGAS